MREFVCLPLQDALLRLAAVVDVRSLRVALRDSVQELLPCTVFHLPLTHMHAYIIYICKWTQLKFLQFITWEKSFLLICRMTEPVVSVSTSLQGAYRPKPFCKCMRLVAHYINYSLINVSSASVHMSLCLILYSRSVCASTCWRETPGCCLTTRRMKCHRRGRSGVYRLCLCTPSCRCFCPTKITADTERSNKTWGGGGAGELVAFFFLSTWEAGATWMNA